MTSPRGCSGARRGSSDGEKAMGALEAAPSVEGGGRRGARRRGEGTRGRALARLSMFFEEAAAAEPDTAEHAHSARAAERLAGTMRAVGSAGHDEL